MFGFQVYRTEVDDRGIDFVVRYENNPFLCIQVKSTRALNYVFVRKDKFFLTNENFLALVLLEERKEPALYLIPGVTWKQPNPLFVDRQYEDRASRPEWGMNLSQKNLPLLEPYSFERQIRLLNCR